MRSIIIVLTCLASWGCARKVHTRTGTKHRLAKLFLESDAATAFNPAVFRSSSLASHPLRPGVLDARVSKLAPHVRMSTAEGAPELLPGGTKDWQVAVQTARERAAALKGLNDETFAAAGVFAFAVFVLIGFPVFPTVRDALVLVFDLIGDQLRLAFDFGPVFYAGILGAYGYSQEGTPFGDIVRSISRQILSVAGKEGGKKQETLAAVGVFSLLAFVLTGFPLISLVLDLFSLVAHLIGDQLKLFLDVGLPFYAGLFGLYCGYFREDQLGNVARTSGRFGAQAAGIVQEKVEDLRKSAGI